MPPHTDRNNAAAVGEDACFVSERIVLATVGAPHGIRGEVRLKSFAANPISLREYGSLLSEDGRGFEIEHLRTAGATLIAKFRGIDDRDAAACLTGLQLGVERSSLPAPDEDEFYYADLIGLEARDPNGNSLGHIVAVQNYGAGDILEIAPPKRPSLLVAFTKANVPDIDISAGHVTIVPPAETEIERPEEKE